MKSIKLLDCTLRDGGFVNEWNFGLGSIKSIVSRLARAGIDVIELGFIDERVGFDPDRSIRPDPASFNPVMENVDKHGSMIVGMIDYGTCGLEHVQPAGETVLDGIRVIFKKKDMDAAVAFCAGIKAKGYRVFAQPVSVTSYGDQEMERLLDALKAIGPYSVSVVDTYGLMHKEQLLHFFEMMDASLGPDTMIGYHSHNNFQLAYSNCIELANIDASRHLLLDGSLYGMGKGAGNANTELLAMNMNRWHGGTYDIDQLLESIDVDIMKEYERHYWGYSLLFYIAALNDCHPDYVKNLIARKTFSVKSINAILQRIPREERLSYKKDLIEHLAEDFQLREYDDHDAYARLGALIAGRDVLVIAPGASLERNRGQIDDYLESRKPLVFSINFVPDDFDVDFVFMGNPKRYNQFFDRIHSPDRREKVICTSNISDAAQGIDFLLDFKSLMCEEKVVRDNPALMLLKALARAGKSRVAMAGFDGYSSSGAADYCSDYVKYLYCDEDVMKRNEAVRSQLSSLSSRITVDFITPSAYLEASA
jgi:4-hydroxy 2-oxovalerate aldolase